jgi:hypothetical protein
MDRLIKRHPHLLLDFCLPFCIRLCVMILKRCRRNVVSKKGQLPSPGCTRISGASALMKTNSKIFASEVAAALNSELGQTRAHIKIVAAWTGANERTVKNWFAGNYGPSGDHLVTLIRYSDTVLSAVLSMSNRQSLLKTSKFNEIERRLIELTSLVQNQDESDD